MAANTLQCRCLKSGKFTLAAFMGFVAVVGLLCLMINMAWQRTLRHFSAPEMGQSRINALQVDLAVLNKWTSNPHGHFPWVNQYNDQGRPMHSWRVLLLPELGEDQLYGEYDFSQPWDSPHNLKLVDKMPTCYASPFWQDEEANRKGRTPYRALVSGENKIDERIGDWAQNVRHASRPIIVQDYANPVPWTKPDGVTLEHVLARSTLDDPHMKGILFLFSDGSFKVLSEEDRGLLEAMVSEASDKEAFDR